MPLNIITSFLSLPLVPRRAPSFAARRKKAKAPKGENRVPVFPFCNPFPAEGLDAGRIQKKKSFATYINEGSTNLAN